MRIELYMPDGTLQCRTNSPVNPETPRAALAGCGLTVVSTENRMHPAMRPALCGAPTGRCWVFEVAKPSRQALKCASQAGFRVWSFDTEGLDELIEVCGPGDGFPWRKFLKGQHDGVDILPLAGDAGSAAAGGDPIDPWPWKALAERLSAATGAGDTPSDDTLVLFDDPPVSGGSAELQSLLGLELRVFSPDHQSGDASYNLGRLNLRVNDARSIIAAWIG